MTKILFPFILFIQLSIACIAQNPTINVFDAVDKKPIPNVHVCTDAKESQEQHYWVSDKNGKLENKVKTTSQIAISFVGYETLIDTIEPSKEYTFYLKPKAQSLNEVIITGQIKPIKVDKSIYKVQLINSQQINNRAANNMADLLAAELNVNVQNSGVLGSSISMQGLSGEHIKILVDGVPVIGRQNGNIDLSQLNLQNVDHIEIIEGSMSVVYGSNAAAGAINIITKKNTRPKYVVGANTYFESVGSSITDVLYTKNYKNHHINFTAGHNFFNGYKFSDNYRRYDFHPKRQWYGTGDYILKTQKGEFQLSQDFFNEKLMYIGNVGYGLIKEFDIWFHQFP